MVKNENKEILGLVYREFSRQKYNKYKHQFPKMRESEIVNKIIREWDTLDPISKRRLVNIYCQNRSVHNEDLSESETAKKSEAALITEHGSGKKDQNIASLGLPPDDDKCCLDDNQLGQNRKGEEKGEQMPTKNKMIGKGIGTDYITFFRHYYDKYSKEHPRWNSSQVSKIVTLLWRKNKLNNFFKIKRSKLERPTKIRKLLTGKTAFKKMKNLSVKDSSRLWKRMPIESKLYWQGQAQGKLKEQKSEHTVTLRGCEIEEKNLKFLNNVIR